MRNIVVDESRLLELWSSSLRNDQLAEALGVTRDALSSLRLKYGLPIRKHTSPRGQAACKPDPTIDEIYERAEAVRRQWSKEEEERRRVCGAGPMTVRAFAFSRRTMSYAAIDG